MKIKSTFADSEEVPLVNTCLGPNINPSLIIEDIPAGTQSMVLIFEDADASPNPWTHWMLFNIPPHINRIEEGKLPPGATEGLANNHSFGYEGPCPKYFKGTHHYWFRLYALDTILDLPKNSEREDVEKKMKNHIIDKAELLGLCTSPEYINA
jgi:Raf kinase inhibitor-like YbhB/YbcL family protein